MVNYLLGVISGMALVLIVAMIAARTTKPAEKAEDPADWWKTGDRRLDDN